VLSFSSVYKESVNFTTFFYFSKKKYIYIDIVVEKKILPLGTKSRKVNTKMDN